MPDRPSNLPHHHQLPRPKHLFQKPHLLPRILHNQIRTHRHKPRRHTRIRHKNPPKKPPPIIATTPSPSKTPASAQTCNFLFVTLILPAPFHPPCSLCKKI